VSTAWLHWDTVLCCWIAKRQSRWPQSIGPCAPGGTGQLYQQVGPVNQCPMYWWRWGLIVSSIQAALACFIICIFNCMLHTFLQSAAVLFTSGYWALKRLGLNVAARMSMLWYVLMSRTAWCGQTQQLVHRTTYHQRYWSHRVVVDCMAGNVTGGLSAYFSTRCLSVCIKFWISVEHDVVVVLSVYQDTF